MLSKLLAQEKPPPPPPTGRQQWTAAAAFGRKATGAQSGGGQQRGKGMLSVLRPRTLCPEAPAVTDGLPPAIAELGMAMWAAARPGTDPCLLPMDSGALEAGAKARAQPMTLGRASLE